MHAVPHLVPAQGLDIAYRTGFRAPTCPVLKIGEMKPRVFLPAERQKVLYAVRTMIGLIHLEN